MTDFYFYKEPTAMEIMTFLDPRNSPDSRRAEGLYGMACWNALSEAQQRMLIEKGNLPIGYLPEGECPNPARVEIGWMEGDAAPGPRFYCLSCAIAYLEEQCP